MVFVRRYTTFRDMCEEGIRASGLYIRCTESLSWELTWHDVCSKGHLKYVFENATRLELDAPSGAVMKALADVIAIGGFKELTDVKVKNVSEDTTCALSVLLGTMKEVRHLGDSVLRHRIPCLKP